MAIEKEFRGNIGVRKNDVNQNSPKLRSSRWQHWNASLDIKTCEACAGKHGRIYALDAAPEEQPPLHEHCRCIVEVMQAVKPEAATVDGEDGAPWQLMYQGILPESYIAVDALMGLGWYSGKNPDAYAPGKMLFGGVFPNIEGKLPRASGRIWYEADIDYHGGSRNGHRVLWSNDGLMFVTYNHYLTFVEVTGG